MNGKILALLIIYFFSSNVYSKKKDFNKIMGCTALNGIVTGLDIKSPIALKCGEKFGNIKKNTKLEYLKVEIINTQTGDKKTTTLMDPPGNVADYHDRLNSNDWIRDQIPGLHAHHSVVLSEDGYGLSKSVPLYKDYYGDEETSISAEAPPTDSTLQSCAYSQRVIMLTSQAKNSCDSMKICYGEASCKTEQGLIHMSAYCQSKDGVTCPTATDCVNDKSLQYSYSDQDQLK